MQGMHGVRLVGLGTRGTSAALGAPHGRHSRENGNPFCSCPPRRRPNAVIPANAFVDEAEDANAVIPARAGIQLFVRLGERVMPRMASFAQRGFVARFRSPRRRAGVFSLLAQREGTKRKGTPRRRPRGFASRVRGRRPVAPSASLRWRRNARDPSRAPFGPFRPPPAGAEGTRWSTSRSAKAQKRGATLSSRRKPGPSAFVPHRRHSRESGNPFFPVAGVKTTLDSGLRRSSAACLDGVARRVRSRNLLVVPAKTRTRCLRPPRRRAGSALSA